MLEKYPKDVKLVFKNFPLNKHLFAKKAAVAALAAKEQGKFWEFHDRLFVNFSSLNDEKIRAIAAELELDIGRFEKSMKNPEIMSVINNDIQEAASAGVRGTPTVFINGKLMKNRNLKGFQDMINSELERLPKKSGN